MVRAFSYIFLSGYAKHLEVRYAESAALFFVRINKYPKVLTEYPKSRQVSRKK